MAQSARAKQLAARFPAELRPNPLYEYELPREISDRVVEIDIGSLGYFADMAERGAKRGFPRERR